IFYEEVALGLQLRCNECKAKSSSDNLREESTGYCFATTSIAYWRNWEHWQIPRGIPIFFHRCAVTRELFDLIVELRPSSTSGAIAEQIKREYGLYHSVVYADDLHRHCSAVCGSLDSMFKVSSKASLTDKDCQCSKHLKGGILSVLNEDNQIVSWVSTIPSTSHTSRFCQSKSNAEITEVLMGLKRCTELLGKTAPEMIVSDNCCAVWSALLVVFPQVDSIQDVWHFIARYLVTIMNASKNPLRSAVMADIMNAILKKHAKDGGSGAEYWSRLEQEEQLIAAYDKWLESGTVWSAASLKVQAVK
ncbi:hypothetical protein EDC04DRAFT_2572146, partial [Pisolithus marmoratus]